MTTTPNVTPAPAAAVAAERTMADRVEELRRRKAEIALGGGEKRLAKQRDAGKLTARERVAELLDPDSFVETGLFA
jgi:methylmalonyl-CoA carboxyltransferase large subunit